MILKPVDIIIPTMNNFEYLQSCLRSMMLLRQSYPFQILVVNNGAKGSCDTFAGEHIRVLEPGKNLGWEGGNNAGLAVSESEFVISSNDDVFLPLASLNWIRMLMEQMADPLVASVGPQSNVVMGSQNMFSCPTKYVHPAPFLIGYCVMHRRSALEKVKESTGYYDETCPGGDDLDLGLRYRKAGYHLICHNGVFVYHHGFKTGIRVYGDHTQGGWNSVQMTDKTNNWLIRKHGFKAFQSLWRPVNIESLYDLTTDQEGNMLRDLTKQVPHEVIVEVGCGGNKTVPESIGVDRIPKGEPIPFVNQTSVADVVCDANGVLPFEDGYADVVIARHVIEHVVDTVGFLTECGRILKPGGTLLLATPNEDECQSVPMNTEHVHAWNPDALQKILELSGFGVLQRLGFENRITMMFRCEKLHVAEVLTFANSTSLTSSPTVVLS